MNYLIILLSLLFLSGNPEPDPRVLSVSVEGQVELPADIIRFNINLNAEAETPQAAYRLHSEREKALVNLLDNYDITEEDINYEPVSIFENTRPNRGEEQKETYQTRQTVNLTIEDFKIYEQLQIKLIENGFDNFNGSFMSSKAEEGKDRALQNAIQTAKEKAQLIAKEAGLELGKINRIEYSQNQNRPMYSRAMSMAESSNQLLKFEQTVTVSASVAIDFELVE